MISLYSVLFCERNNIVIDKNIIVTTVFSLQTNDCNFLLTQLSPDTSYKVKLRGIGKHGQIGETISNEFDTISSK